MIENSIGVEMCCTAGNHKISDQTQENAAYVCAYLCKLIGVRVSQVDAYVLRHWDVTHKSFPAQMAWANNSEWTAFKTKVKKILGGNTGSSKKETEYYAKRKPFAKANGCCGDHCIAGLRLGLL